MQEASGNLCWVLLHLVWHQQATDTTAMRKSTGFSGDFREGTMQHSQELHTTESWSSNITQEHPATLGALQAGKERKNHPTTQAVTWHWTLLNCTLRTRISAYSETGGMSSRGRAW